MPCWPQPYDAVGLGHTVHLFLTLHGSAGVVAGIQQFAGQALSHGLFTAFPGKVDDPAESQRLTALGADFDRHLIGGAANAAGLDFQLRRDVVQGFLEHVGRSLARLLGNSLKSLIADVLRDSALSVQHDLIDQFSHYLNRIRQHFTFRYKTATRHMFPS